VAGLPIRVVRGRGASAERDDEHPIIDLLERPSAKVPGYLFRRQLVTDLTLVGDAYALIAGAGEPAALIRLHPERVTVIPGNDGQPAGFEYDTGGSRIRYDWKQVLHVRSPSWEDTPSGLYGTGAIRALAKDLTTDLRAQEMAANTAETGRPSGVFSPKDPSDRWSSAQVDVLRSAYEKAMKGKSGALFLGGPVEYRNISLSPADMEHQETRRWVRDAVLAAIGVVPVRVGIAGETNYATASNQMRLYWTDLQAKTRLIDSELTRIARMFNGSEDVRVFHDFSDVEALQESRTERVNRVNQWWLMGIPLADAAVMEGFDELPAQEQPSRDEETEVDRSVVTRGIDTDPLERWLVLEGGELFKAPHTEEGRAQLWRGFIEQVHGPAERDNALAMRRYLKSYSARIAKRLAEQLDQRSAIVQVQKDANGIVTKAITDVALDKILDQAGEKRTILGIFRPLFRKALARTIAAAVKLLPVDFEFDTRRVDTEARSLVGSMIDNIQTTQRDEVRRIINAGVNQGSTITEVQRAIATDKTFSPMSARRIARTETTKLATAGTQAAIQEASDLGVDVKLEWVSARDEHVRDAHQELDGEKVSPGELFTYNGATAEGPGQFGVGELDINCRCWAAPFVMGVS